MPDPIPDRTFEFVADKIGFVPNVRRQDNLLQLKWIGGTCVIAIAVSFALIRGVPFYIPITCGLLAGLVLGALISGSILAIRNLRR